MAGQNLEKEGMKFRKFQQIYAFCLLNIVEFIQVYCKILLQVTS